MIALMVKEGIVFYRFPVDCGVNPSVMLFGDSEVQRVKSVEVMFHCEC